MSNQNNLTKIAHLFNFEFWKLFCENNKEILLYLFFGGLTFFISIISFAFFYMLCGINELIANIFSWILAVIFAFFTNRIWVFAAPTNTVVKFIKQFFSFVGGRVATLIIEEIILYVFISRLKFPSMVIKIIAQIIVIALNYFLSKTVIFKKNP